VKYNLGVLTGEDLNFDVTTVGFRRSPTAILLHAPQLLPGTSGAMPCPHPFATRRVSSNHKWLTKHQRWSVGLFQPGRRERNTFSRNSLD
jgi:hypothetical protein